MRKFAVVLLHLLGYPVLLAAVVYFNLNVISTQMKNYGVYVFVGLIIAVLMTIIYYICYIGITKKREKNAKSIFNQTIRLCLVVVITMTGLWVVMDKALPNFLADKTSNTIYYEELADGWKDREEANAELLNDFIRLSVKAGTLPYDHEEMDEDEAIEYYQGLGLNQTVEELADNEYYKSIGGLFAIQFQSIDANGYQTFTHPWIDFATGDRLTIPCLVHLLLDKREIAADKITNEDFTEYKENADGTREITSVFFVVYDKDANEITLEHVNWTVLDMLGEDNVVDLSGLELADMDIGGIVTNPVVSGMIEPLLTRIVSILKSEDILGSEVYLKLSGNPEEQTFFVTLSPANEARGVMGYQQMAWLDSNGLLYAIATLFSTRKVFLIFGAWGVIINMLIGMARGMGKEEKEKKNRAMTPKKVKPRLNMNRQQDNNSFNPYGNMGGMY